MTEHAPNGKTDPENIIDDEPGRIPPPMPDHEPDGQSAADAFEADTRNQLNLLRDRTFNPELKQLVDRVRENEPEASAVDGVPEDVDFLDEDELRLRLYRLYYRARVLHDNREMNVSFNPFEFIDSSSGVSIHDALEVYIMDGMLRLSLSPFAVLSYSVVEKGYIPALHNLERYHVENIVIGLRDRLFRDILENGEGVIVEADTLRDDPFLEKIFYLNEGEYPRSLYFVLIGYLVSDIAQELRDDSPAGILPFLPSSILMIELPQQTSPYNRGAISGSLRKKLALPYYLLNDDRSLIFASDMHEDMDYSYHAIDYLFTLFLLRRDRIGISIKSKTKDNTNRAFLMKYIISQLSYKLHADSVLIHMIKDQIIILTKDAFVEMIRSLIGEYNKLFNDQFSAVEFHPSEFKDSLDIIEKIILNNT